MTIMSDKIKNLSRNELQELVKKSKLNKINKIKSVERTKSSYLQSFSQQRQWYMEQLMNGGVYNVPQSYRINGKLDIQILEDVLNQIVERHESLRTVFKTIDYVPSQIINPFREFKLKVIDLSGEMKEVQEAKVEKINEEEAIRPFDLSIGPLFRFTVIALSEEEYILTIILHHIISDAWSFGVLIREIAKCYTENLNQYGGLAPLEVQYLDYSEWQREFIQSDNIKKQLDFWKVQLEGLPEYINLPLDKKRPVMQTNNGDNYVFEIGKKELEDIQKLCLEANVTMYHGMLSIFLLMLYRYTFDNDILIGTPIANRDNVQLEELIGLFINTIIIRNKIDGDKNYLEFIQSVKQVCMDAFDNKDIPFEQVVEQLNIERRPEYTPVFQVLYVQTEESMIDINIPGLEFSAIPVSSKTAQFDLSLYLTVMKEGIRAGFEYNTDLFNLDTIQQMARDFISILNKVIENPDQSINDIISSVLMKKINILIASSFETEPIGESMEYWMKRLEMPYKISFAPYAQVFQQLVDQNSLLRKNYEGINVIMLRLEDWIQGEFEQDEKLVQLNQNVDSLIQCFRQISDQIGKTHVYLCPPSENIKNNVKIYSEITNAEDKIIRKSSLYKNIDVINALPIAKEFNITEYNDESGDAEGHIPYTLEYFTALGTHIVKSILGKSISYIKSEKEE